MSPFSIFRAALILVASINTGNTFCLSGCRSFQSGSRLKARNLLRAAPRVAVTARSNVLSSLTMSEAVERGWETSTLNDQQESQDSMCKQDSLEVGDVERFLKSRDVEYTIVAVERGEEEEVNAESTAVLLGVNSSVVVKSLVFVVGNHPVLVVLSGNKKVSIKKLSQCLKQKRDRLRERGESMAIADRAASVKLAPSEDAEEWTGYRIGMIPPFAHRRSMLTIVDEEVLRTPRVFVGCGRMELELSIKVEDLLAVTGAVVADVGRVKEEGRREGPLLPYSRFHTSVTGGKTKVRQVLEGGEEEEGGGEEERERDEEEAGEETGSDKVYEITSEWKDVDPETLPSTFLTGDFCLISANKIGRRLLFGFAVHRDMRQEVARLVSSRSLHRSGSEEF
ncbi:hypothetical protein GUITHDRAFT_107601 [Guillardia theta CCMP2712]|uniref:YbaK/aminoacyl-tRNA synthetase-associated domain-containing protein n=2 Tax=Guillardia theta TaxID=55529 RepID=L1JCZ3_GUITC|nr:hypothetical protein GUITHDRAFT_107601 [Guillardia theta CCMP2712]EKX46398.1 hypothetical protein GUITHDRAFT_107601 [Guillardia theta CCMP2712]|eukprot:XP_005833378.1 hypothetical protein GUITHDRAFT_107601 [Guillardia theta CCMP2712]